MNSSLYSREKKVPIPLVILSIFMLFGLFSLGFNHSQKTKGKELVEKLVVYHEVTNITNNSAEIVVCLSKKAPLTLLIKADNSEEALSAYDNRDISTSLQSRLCHYFSVRDLASEKYLITANSYSNVVSDPFELQMGEQPKNNSTEPLWGKVVDASGQPLATGIVIANFDKSTPISTLIKNGDWVLPIHYLSFVPGVDTVFKLTAYAENGQKIQLRAAYGSIDEIHKTLVVGKSYDFTQKKEEDKLVLGVETTNGKTQPIIKKIDIVYPQAGATIPSFKPLFKGVALPDKKVTILLDEFSAASRTNKVGVTHEVVTNKDGIWVFIPSTDLDSGDHTIRIKTVDEEGRAIAVKRNYEILKSGEGVLGLATPSASLTPTESPITPTDVPLPTAELLPTSEPTVIPITPDLPRSGMDIYPAAFMSVLFIAIGFGLLMFYI